MHQVKDILRVLEVRLEAALDVCHWRVFKHIVCCQLDVVLHILLDVDELAFDVCQ